MGDRSKNLIVITSVINTPNIPLSYAKVRSVFSRRERFNQTKKTINSIKQFIPDRHIMLVECTDFTEEESGYFRKECDTILNLWEKNELHLKIFGASKSLGEGTMTRYALNYILKNNLQYDNLFKICGRYWLNEHFDYDTFCNNKLVFKKINNNINNIFTSFYKIQNNTSVMLLDFLIKQETDMKKCVGYEELFGKFLKSINYEDVTFIDKIGYEGLVTVCGSKYNG